MDKLTAIKIKYDDGTYSDEIPVSVLAENVEWDSTHTLVDVLGSIDVDVTGTIQDQISQLFNEKVSNSDMQKYISNSLPTYITTWLNDNVNPVGSAVIVDSSLSIEGAAADANITGKIRNDLSEITGLENIPFTDYSMVTTNVETGSFVDITQTHNDVTDSIVTDCSHGDLFYISGYGWNQQRLWAFVDASNKLLIKSASGMDTSNAVLIAPEGAAKIIVNAQRKKDRRLLRIHSNGLLRSVNGGHLNLNTDTISLLCDSNLDNLPNNIIYGCSVSDGSLLNVPDPIFKGLIITIGKESVRTNSDSQIAIMADEPRHSWRFFLRVYWSNVWSSWVKFTNEDIEKLELDIENLKDNIPMLHIDDQQQLAKKYSSLLANVDINLISLASRSRNIWQDLPSTDNRNGIFINQRYSTNYNLQSILAFSSRSLSRYERISDRNTGDLYSNWIEYLTLPHYKILALGDSICYGWRNSNKGFVGDLGLPYKNIGISGATLSTKVTNVKNIPQQLLDESDYNPDVIIANGGINDYAFDAPLGTLNLIPVSTDSEAEALDKTTLLGGVEYLFYLMIKKYPTAQRYFVITNKVYRYNKYYPTTKNTAGYTQQEMHDALISACKLYNVYPIDIYQDSLLNSKFDYYISPSLYEDDNPEISEQYYIDADRLHPFAKGYKEAYIPLVRKALFHATLK